MDHLFTRNPILKGMTYKTVGEYRTQLINEAAEFNIATGYISSEALVELKRIVDIRNHEISINLFVGMNYLEGFTKLQYNTLKDLSTFFMAENAGQVLISPSSLYHGKMYSFNDSNGVCLGAFVGSSNLSSFLGTSQNYIESDVYFRGPEAEIIDRNLKNVIRSLGQDFYNMEPITKFLPAEKDLLKGLDHVKKLSSEEFRNALTTVNGPVVEIPLKTEKKSNLNTYFGAGKTKGRYSPRSWYEVEIIISKTLENRDLLPESGPFKVMTPEGYMFECERQGDYSKNFRSCHDLRILGKWIKGQMENEGVIQCGQLITQDTLDAFGKSKLVLKKSSEDFLFIELR